MTRGHSVLETPQEGDDFVKQYQVKKEQEVKNKVNEVIDAFEYMKNVDYIGYMIVIKRELTKTAPSIEVCMTIEVDSSRGAEYIRRIQECSDKVDTLGFENTRLTTSNDSDGKSRAYIHSIQCLI